MPTFQQTPNGRWQAQIRRHGRRSFKVFDTRGEAEEWASLVEAEARDAYEGTVRILKRHGAFLAAWGHAERVLRSGGGGREPEDATIAAFIADSVPLQKIAGMIAGYMPNPQQPVTAEQVLAIKAALEMQVEAVAEVAAAERRRMAED
jgi:hypothetical protein